MTIPKITKEHVELASLYVTIDASSTTSEWVRDICNKAIEITLVEQQAKEALAILPENLIAPEAKVALGDWIDSEQEYITAAQARELGLGNVEYFAPDATPPRWFPCTGAVIIDCFRTNEPIKYRAIKQAQPEQVDNDDGFLKRFKQNVLADAERALQVDPHADLCVEYLRQRNNVPRELGFYLWEYKTPSDDSWRACTIAPRFMAEHGYRYTDISCYVSKDGEPAIRMLQTEAQELQAELGDSVDWYYPTAIKAGGWNLDFDGKGTYTYHTKATIKLDGRMVTPEQAAAEWEAKKETHDVYYKNSGSAVSAVIGHHHCLWVKFSECKSEYELRPQATDMDR